MIYYIYTYFMSVYISGGVFSGNDPWRGQTHGMLDLCWSRLL